MPRPASTEPEVEDRKLWKGYGKRLIGILTGLFGARLGVGYDEDAVREAAAVLADMTATGDVFGRYRVAEAARKVEEGVGGVSVPLTPDGPTAPPSPPADPTPPSSVGSGGGESVRIGYGNVTFKDAVEQFSRRHPEIAQNADAIRKVYEKNGFALAKSADKAVTKRVQDEITRYLKGGYNRREAIAAIQKAGAGSFEPWSEAYSKTVFRNATTQAYAAGTFQRLRTPEAQALIPAIEFDAVLDTRTTDICRAFHGTLAPATHQVWDKRCPPCHHNCRSYLRLRDKFSLGRQGKFSDGKVLVNIPNQHVVAAVGFGKRRDISLYGPRI